MPRDARSRLDWLEHRDRIDEPWNVIAEAWGAGDEEAVYTLCGRRPGEANRQLTPDEYQQFVVGCSATVLRLYIRGRREDPEL